MTINIEKWNMSFATYKGLSCTVPCSMYSVLLEHGMIEDPFYGLNELDLTAYSDKDCVFEAEFDADNNILEKEYVELEFYGLDTLCRISLNGKLLGNTRNMHRKYLFDVKSALVKGTNRLKLEFSSPTKYFQLMDNKHHLFTNRDSIPGSSHLRKGFYMSGWDWGPKLPDMGIFRKVCLDAYDTDKIESIHILQNHLKNQVVLDVEVETRHSSNCAISVSIDGHEMILDKNRKAQITIENPKLWWVRGYGEQPLYEIKAKMIDSSATICEKVQKIGLRTLTLSTAPDADGSEFCFVINGVKIFAMGANYIPQDNLLSRISPDRTEKLIQSALDANFNCLRVWGGGYYPEDEFYDICDRYGIMVWQDFMIACAPVWLGNGMKEEYREEAIYNIKRLRHHPSLALFCGNNEVEELFIGGFADSMLVQQDYIELFERMFPALCDQYAPQTSYRPSSPSSYGGADDPRNEAIGDSHFWKVWHKSAPFTEFRNHRFRFCSEYGFESYPSLKTIHSYCPPEDMNCFSRIMENHQKCRSGNSKILGYLADNYLYPHSFEALVYASQLLQADAIKYGVEHFRRCRPYCMGSLYWQFNDCWPVCSWSSIDYFGRYKALHYAAKKFYSPVAIALFLDDNKLTINISNETMHNFAGEVRVYHCDSDFNTICRFTETVSVSQLTSEDVFTGVFSPSDIYNEYIYADLYDNDGSFIMRQTALFVKPKQYSWKKPIIESEVYLQDDKITIDIKADTFAKGVYIDFDNMDLILSDNYFDITNSDTYRVTASGEYNIQDLKDNLRIMSVYNIR
ncbi:MAG: glycoside hydrolase family 2 protein [Oscillospiraceae bacterium]|nr:glycoside hydrolase family 2 protein [Oscillospiraceae bacterium]